ncbi:MAG: ferrous iron transport protein A [Candidatus Omnitrophica bacterium]|nr:ferrous iron transport protein A [Candidatus Omnitrophota bacterium]
MKKITLVQMKAGAKGRIVQLEGGPAFESRLSAMGVRIDKHIVKLSAFVLQGPVAIRSGNTVLALGYGMASKIWVELIKK